MAEQKASKETVVEILDGEYRLEGEEESYLKELASYVDNQIKICKETDPSLPTGRLGILACLNISDQLYQQQREYNELASQTRFTITTLIEKIDTLLDCALFRHAKAGALEQESGSEHEQLVEST